jgi:hypothetical protein
MVHTIYLVRAVRLPIEIILTKPKFRICFQFFEFRKNGINTYRLKQIIDLN